MELQVGVKILLKNPEGKFLLLLRSREKYKDVKGEWDIVGGRIDPGSPLLDNLRREVQEETGLNFIGEARLVAAQDILRIPGRHVIRLTYTGDITCEPKLHEEHTEFGWFSIDEIRQMENLDIYAKELVDKKILE